MSIDLPYPVRLFWENGRGVARWNGKPRMLGAAPAIEGLPVFDMIDYVPSVVEMIRPRGFATRYHLEPAEKRGIEEWLQTMKGLW